MLRQQVTLQGNEPIHIAMVPSGTFVCSPMIQGVASLRLFWFTFLIPVWGPGPLKICSHCEFLPCFGDPKRAGRHTSNSGGWSQWATICIFALGGAGMGKMEGFLRRSCIQGFALLMGHFGNSQPLPVNPPQK